jgi:hypothetical protein
MRVRGRILMLGAGLIMLGSCSSADDGQSAILYGQACKPFDPDVTNSCVISSERRSEITELPEPPGMYRYCAWPGLLSGKYRTQYRDVDGSIHDFTQTPVLTPSFLLEAFKASDNSVTTELVQYRMIAYSHPCPDSPP